jgi:hypothetical protein
MAKPKSRVYRLVANSVVAVEFNVEDLATPLIAKTRLKYPERIGWAIASTGWEVSKEIKKGMRKKAPGGQAWATFMPLRKRKKLDEDATSKPWGRLLNAVGYVRSADKKGVMIGWTDSANIHMASKLERGFRIHVTEKLRRKYAAAGMVLKESTREIVVPKRPLFEPMKKHIEPMIVPHMEKKLREYEANGGKKT